MKYFFNRFRTLWKLKQFFRENAAQGKPLCVMDDLVFKTMLSMDTEDSRQALRSLVSACTQRKVSSVRLVNNELIPAHLMSKPVRLDVNVTFNDGEIANLEMQIKRTDDDLKNRAAYYSAMLLAAQAERGKPYKEIKRVYQIFFLNCILFPQSNKLPRRYRLMEVEEHDVLTEVTEIIFYELPKLKQRVNDYLAGKSSIENLSDEEMWCIFMKYRDKERVKPLIMELYRKEEGIMQAEKSLARIARNYSKYIREMSIKKNNYERAVMVEAARKELQAQWHAEGRKKERELFLELLKSGKSQEEILKLYDK